MGEESKEERMRIGRRRGGRGKRRRKGEEEGIERRGGGRGRDEENGGVW